MSLLQAFGFKDSSYERPNQKWVCGRSAEGRGCNMGPDQRGNCQASFECIPNRQGDRWHCTRDALGGGKCEDGPGSTGQCSRAIPRCLPVRSVRYRRARAVRWAFFAMLGGVLLSLSGANHLDFVSSGDLTHAHGASATECADCHSTAHGDLAQWLITAFDPPPGTEESRLCLSCHRLGDAALRAHSLSAAELDSLSDRARQRPGANEVPGNVPASFLGLGVKKNQDGELACATCHREHQGQDFDLAVISDTECQTCHLRQFDSFVEGHPEIAEYAFDRRTRLIFDHLSHKDKHFPEQEQTFQCATCHELDTAGQLMLAAGFDAACGECHGAQVEGDGQAGDKGVAVLGVPGLDLAFVSEHGIAIGEWPEDADAEMPPIMALLLAADPAYAESIGRLADQDLLDMQGADAGLGDAVADYAWAVKTLFHELMIEGQQALQRRLESVWGKKLSTGELAALTGTMPPQVIRAAQQAWFPNLGKEMRRRSAGESLPFPDGQADAGVVEESRGGIDREPLDVPSDATILTDTGDEIPLEDDAGDILGGDEAADSGGDILGGDGTADSGGDILGADVAGEEAGDILGDESEEEVIGALEDPAFADAETAEAVEPVSGEDWVRAGGWYRQYATLLYRPSGHDDRFMLGWLDLTASIPGSDGANPSHAVFRQLADAKGPGLCTKCHSVDAAGNGGLRVNWTGLRPMPDKHRFTDFNHRAHLSLLDQDGCLLCHSFSDTVDGDARQTYAGTDPAVHQSNFAAYEKATCARCHQPEMTGDSCLTCHNYHVGTFPWDEVLTVNKGGQPQ